MNDWNNPARRYIYYGPMGNAKTLSWLSLLWLLTVEREDIVMDSLHNSGAHIAGFVSAEMKVAAPNELEILREQLKEIPKAVAQGMQAFLRVKGETWNLGRYLPVTVPIALLEILREDMASPYQRPGGRVTALDAYLQHMSFILESFDEALGDDFALLYKQGFKTIFAHFRANEDSIIREGKVISFVEGMKRLNEVLGVQRQEDESGESVEVLPLPYRAQYLCYEAALAVFGRVEELNSVLLLFQI
uniref:Uncharacterized protein n=1 Tax=Chromera velia CCMP2878 TaxID=1169474 RepID=A0A0G4IBN9_9ALVE|eukprot:Cvel_12809.t1-p1 / transcript=Cvel_12809.t1 / gene=Cvel_12809 / organism=Chromera_velia_CCMP2878 / gene_product=hypothetical protein / transcript_product=hypothetical protein / location=Cvel_scaffold853:42402-43136(+) / protein_length=245 / sequence_SO=supercontig / SO=protein_coding / is_pseudo=false